MAPQNSTFIHENSSVTSELSRYSPILPLNEHDNDVHKKQSISSHATTRFQDEEIPIWICDVPRYISGISVTTTCHDIIKALINDEIRSQGYNTGTSHDFNDYVISEKWRGIEQALHGETYILPIWHAWGIARNEVKFKLKINKKRAELPESINQRHGKAKKRKRDKVNFVTQLLRKITKQSEIIQDYLSKFGESQQFSKYQSDVRFYKNEALPRQRVDEIRNIDIPSNSDDDELFLAIEAPDDDKDSGIQINRKCKFGNHFSSDENIHRPKIISGKSRSRRSHISSTLPRSLFSSRRRNCSSFTKLMNDRFLLKNVSEYIEPCNKIDLLQNQIVEKTSRIKDLIDLKVHLKDDLLRKCDEYKAINELYRTNAGLELCIDEVQSNLEQNREEIIKIEVELYRTKADLRKKSDMLSNLMRMLSSEISTKKQNDFENHNVTSISSNVTLYL